MQLPFLIYAYVLVTSFCLALVFTGAARKVAVRWGVLDQPGDRKMHGEPVPLMGGVAIVAAFYLMTAGHILILILTTQFGMAWIEENLLLFLGEGAKVKVAGILAGGLIIFVLGVVDDLAALTPWVKLIGQIVAATVLVLSGIQLELFVLSSLWLAAPVTILWVVLMTNSMNFLDNMDGLSGGVTVIACISFFLCVQVEDQLVRLLLMILAGSTAGFLYHNINPARIFMGDAGSMFTGYMLATIALLGTFHVEGTPSRVAVAAPVLALSVPLFDTLSVVFIRWRSGQNIMLGDKRHFSHRLVDLGMTPRHAVEFIYLVGAVVGLGAALLPLLDFGGTIIIIAQTVGVYLLIVLLMNAKQN
jgi:UDP-GlcNAc:undecaprenyl-phosphate GlcNAc-1-phosphate transferase